MKTEGMVRRVRGRDPNEVSRALQDLTPLSCVVVDRRGRPVPLSSAGYVLYFGGSYRVRVLSPFEDAEVQTVRIVSPPDFLTVETALRDRDEEGRLVHAIPFKVTLDLWTHLRRLGMGLHSDELHIGHEFQPSTLKDAPPFLCPVIVRPRLLVVLVAVLLGLAFILLEKLIGALITQEQGAADRVNTLTSALMRWETWASFLMIAGSVWLLVTAVNLVLLYRRSRELRNGFREAYPGLESLEPACAVEDA